MSPDLVLRDAGPGDVGALVGLESRSFGGDHLSRRSFRRLIGRSSAGLIVADCDGRLVGYALLLFRRGSRKARLYSIARDAEAAPPGTGRALLAAAERLAAASGARELRLEVRTDNAAALRLYEASGYRLGGRRRGYYEDGADALRMAKFLVKDGA